MSLLSRFASAAALAVTLTNPGLANSDLGNSLPKPEVKHIKMSELTDSQKICVQRNNMIGTNIIRLDNSRLLGGYAAANGSEIPEAHATSITPQPEYVPINIYQRDNNRKQRDAIIAICIKDTTSTIDETTFTPLRSEGIHPEVRENLEEFTPKR